MSELAIICPARGLDTQDRKPKTQKLAVTDLENSDIRAKRTPRPYFNVDLKGFGPARKVRQKDGRRLKPSLVFGEWQTPPEKHRKPGSVSQIHPFTDI